MFDFHNDFHLGDCLTSFHSLVKLSEVNEIKCRFCCNPAYHQELRNFSEKVELLAARQPNSTNLWGYPEELVDRSLPFPHHKNQIPGTNIDDVGEMLFKMYNFRATQLGLKPPFENKFGMIFDEEILGKEVAGNYDFLLINSHCMSGQMKISHQEQDQIFATFCNKLKEKGKTFTTTKEAGLSLVEIGQLAKNCKVILGVPTSPLFACINKWSMEKVEKFVNWTHDCCTFDYGEKFSTINNLNEYGI